jgi:phosphonate metabolism-associated iron-containing alcohol dehydrogenase
VNAFQYYNPVRIIFGCGKLSSLAELTGSRRILLVTTPGFVRRGIMEKLRPIKDSIVDTVTDIPANPTFEALRAIYRRVWKNSFDVIVALGGGSVLDGAKALSVYDASKEFEFVENIIRGKSPKKDYRLIPIISIPTTAGTGSEVTPWATVWDMNEKKKYSLHLPDLWSESCICDPELTVSLPADITLHTAMDAFSQALEAVWNKNANPVSTQFSILSAKEIYQTLPKLMNDLTNLEYREKIMLAALHTGLSFSNTQTAVAHAISYYVTAQKGTPHGIACSFTLPDIVESVSGQLPETDTVFRAVWGSSSGEDLRRWMESLGVGTHVSDYGLTPGDLDAIKASLTGNPRANNSLVPVDILFERLRKSPK